MYADSHIKELTYCLDYMRYYRGDIRSIVDMIFAAYKHKQQVFIIGNGGSATTASHFAVDLEKQSAIDGRQRIRARSLADNIGLITAWANDTNYANVFREQLANELNAGDIVICISVSGTSPNIIAAISYAKSARAKVIGFIGTTNHSAEDMKQLADLCIVVPSSNYGVVEDVHLTLTHIIAATLRQRIARCKN